MLKLFVSVLLVLNFSSRSCAQAREKDDTPKKSYANAGFGFGVDYGGHIGTRVSVLPCRWFSAFGGIGLYYYKTGFAGGVQFRLPTEKRVDFYITGLYGVNAGLESEVYITRKQYYGYSVGGGIEVKSNKSEKTFWTIGLLVPFRDPQFQKDVDALKAQGLTVTSTNWPVTLTLGFHFKLDRSYDSRMR